MPHSYKFKKASAEAETFLSLWEKSTNRNSSCPIRRKRTYPNDIGTLPQGCQRNQAVHLRDSLQKTSLHIEDFHVYGIRTRYFQRAPDKRNRKRGHGRKHDNLR